MNSSSTGPYNEPDGEVSLIDLAVIFVKRRRVFFLVFILCALLGVGYSVVADSTYRYISLVQGAMTAVDEPLTPSASLIAALESRWLPEVKAKYESDNGKLPFEVRLESPKDTGLVRVMSETSEDQAELVKQIHAQLISDISSNQEAQLDTYRKMLANQVGSVNQLIDSLKQENVSGEALARAVDRKLNLEQELSSLQPTKVVVTARRNREATGPRRVLIIALSLIMGVILGALSVVLIEFAVRVKGAIRNSAA